MSQLQRLTQVIRQISYSLRARIPEKVLLYGIYVSNMLLISAHTLIPGRFSEYYNILVFVVDVIVAFQFFIPLLIMNFIPIHQYLILLIMVAFGSFMGLVERFPAYYYIITAATVASIIKLEPVVTSPLLSKVGVRTRRALKKVKPPRTVEDVKFSLKLGFVHVATLGASIFIYAVFRYVPALISTVYSLAAILFIMFNIGVRPEAMMTPKGKYSITLMFVLRYRILFELANKMKLRVHSLAERAGVLLYEIEYVSRYIAISVWIILSAPSVILLLSSLVPFRILILASSVILIMPMLVYYYPVISLSQKIKSRKNAVEKEYPLFLVYATALTAAGYTMYHIFKDLAYGRGAELLKQFSKEAKYLISLIDKQGLSEVAALQKYANVHPSGEYRNFMLGYINQLQLGGRIVSFMEQKLNEALDMLKRRMENYIEQVLMLTEIAITVLVLPSLPTILGFIIAPDIVYSMLFIQMFVFIPLMGVMFYSLASNMQLEFRDIYTFTYIPSVVGGAVALGIALVLSILNIVAGAAIVLAGIAFGIYVEYLRHRRIYSEIEKFLPQFFRDLSDLRQTLPIAEAISRMTTMGYPRRFRLILHRVSVLRDQGLRIIEQPWHSKSWFWRFTQFVIGKIEESGGGTPALFRQLTLFFTELNNIMSSLKGSMKIYEAVIYSVPAIFAFVTYSTLGIFVAMSQVPNPINQGTISPEAMQQFGSQFQQLLRMFKGVDPVVLMINDFMILEMSFILGLIAGKIISGTVRDTRALAISMILTAILVILVPQFMNSLIMQSLPKTR